MGAEDAADVAGLYTSEDGVVAAAERLGMDMEATTQMLRSWRCARAQAEGIIAARALESITGRSDTRQSRPQRTWADVVKPKKQKLGAIQQDTPCHPDQWRDGGRKAKQVRAKASEESLDKLYRIWITVGSRGAHWQECQDGKDDVRRRLVLRPFRRMEEKRVKELLGGWRRWTTWNEQKSQQSPDVALEEAISPSPVRLAEFLESVSTGGATAAPGVLSLLQW